MKKRRDESGALESKKASKPKLEVAVRAFGREIKRSRHHPQ